MKLEKIGHSRHNLFDYYKINEIIFYSVGFKSNRFGLSIDNTKTGLDVTNQFTFYELVIYIKNL
jgi:hypothetical protein